MRDNRFEKNIICIFVFHCKWEKSNLKDTDSFFYNLFSLKYDGNAKYKDTYDFVGVGKDDGNNKGEFSPVFYNKHKFELLDKEDFWLSETPERASLGWDGAENRTCTYAVLKEKETELLSNKNLANNKEC